MAVPSDSVAQEKLQLSLYERTDASHRLDNLNLFIYMMLLILTILTAWFFKHFRNRYVHETALALVYGLLIGILIRETATHKTEHIQEFDLPMEETILDSSLPKRVILRTCPSTFSTPYNCSNATDGRRYFEYTYTNTLQADDSTDHADLSSKATFDPEVFFNVILPAIIFNAGYSLKRKHFFINIGAILMFAFVGTLLSAFTIAALVFAFTQIPYFSGIGFTFTDAMLFGSIISATDPVSVLAIFSELGVDVDLHALILGESVLNDAVAIVLSGAVVGYAKASMGGQGSDAEAWAIASAFARFFEVFLGAFAIGTATALVTSLITKYTRLRDFSMLESSLFLLMSYSTFLAAEAASFSGIVALLFCGIFQAHYTYYNLSSESRSSLRYITELISFLAENFCFVQIGVTIFTFSNHYWDVYFILIALLAIIFGRAINVYPLSFIVNQFSKRQIPYPFQHMMMFSGLRGAMAFALAIRDTENTPQRIVFSTTLVLVVVTIIVCGALVTPLLQLFHIRVGVPQGPDHGGQRRRRSGNERSIGQVDENKHPESISPEDVQQVAGAALNRTSTSSTSGNCTEFSSLHTNVHQPAMLAYDATRSPPRTIVHSSDELTIIGNEDNIVDVVANQPVTTRHRYTSKIIRGWKSVDSNYLKPLFTHSRPLLTDTLPKNSCIQWFARLLTTQQQFERGNDDDSVRQMSSADLYSAPTPSPPRVEIFNEPITDTDDEPIVMDTNSPNIAGYSHPGNNREASASLYNNSSRD